MYLFTKRLHNTNTADFDQHKLNENSEEWKKPLYQGCSIIKLKTILLLVSFSNIWCLTREAITQQLLDIFSLVLSEDCTLPRTIHLLKKYFAVEKARPQYYCPSCG